MRVAFWVRQARMMNIVALIASLMLIGSGWMSAKAEEARPISWTTTLEEVKGCVADSKPQRRRAAECYQDVISVCISGPSDEYQACLEDAVKELRGLFQTYNLRSLNRDLADRNAPDRCQDAVKENKPSGMPEEEFLLQCEFTALSRQVVAAHIESVWNEHSQQD